MIIVKRIYLSMANFKLAFDKIVLHEGGYVNNPNDKGGETFMGITRKYHSTSKIWKIIDGYKQNYSPKQLTIVLKRDNEVINCVLNIYKQEYWDKLKLDHCGSQAVANEIFDTAVNMGITKAVKLTQRILGLKETGKITDELIYNIINYGKRTI